MARGLIVLAAIERQSLEAATQSSDPRQVLRSRIVLAAAAGMRNAAIANDLRVDVDTVSKWRRRFAADGLHGLLDRPRPGAPRQMTDREISEMTKRAQAEFDEGKRRTLRSLADALQLPPSTVRRRLLKTGLLPHRRRVPEPIVALPDPESISDIIGAFLCNRTRAVALCVQDRAALFMPVNSSADPNEPARDAPPLPLASLLVQACRRGAKTQASLDQFEVFLGKLAVPIGYEVHIVLDTRLPPHNKAARDWAAGHRSRRIHEASSNWVGSIDFIHRGLTERQIRSGATRSTRRFESVLATFANSQGGDAGLLIWQKSLQEIRADLEQPRRKRIDPHQSSDEVQGDAHVDKWISIFESLDENRIRPNAFWALILTELTRINRAPIIQAVVKTWTDLLQAVKWVSKSSFGHRGRTAARVDASPHASEAICSFDDSDLGKGPHSHRVREGRSGPGDVRWFVAVATRDEARVIELALYRYFESRQMAYGQAANNAVRNPHTRKIEFPAMIGLPDEPVTIKNAIFCALCWRLTNPVQERRTNVAAQLRAEKPLLSEARKTFCRMHSVARGGERRHYRRAALLIAEVREAVRDRRASAAAAASKGQPNALVAFRRCIGESAGTDWSSLIEEHFPSLAAHPGYGDAVRKSPIDAIIALDDVPYAGREGLHDLFRADLPSLSTYLFPMLLFADTWIAVDHRRQHGGSRKG